MQPNHKIGADLFAPSADRRSDILAVHGLVLPTVADTVESLADTVADELLRLTALLPDIQSLTNHLEGVLQRIVFHSSIIMSRSQLAASRTTKVSSVTAALFLPPTLIASIYGMNFEAMPELEWVLGYPVAIGLMIVASVGPFCYFKRKNWL